MAEEEPSIDIEFTEGSESSSGGGGGGGSRRTDIWMSLTYGTKLFRKTESCEVCGGYSIGVAKVEGEGGMLEGKVLCRDHKEELENRELHEEIILEWKEFSGD